MSKLAFALLPLAVLAFAAPAHAASSVEIDGFAGWQNLRPNASSVANAASGREGTAIVGADILGRIEGFGIGVSVDKTTNGRTGQPWAGSVLAGFLIDPLPSLRLEALGELGRRATMFGDMFTSTGQTFVGVRPGVSFRLLPSPVRIGVEGLVRWNTSGGSFSNPDYGIVGKLGVEF